MQVGLDWTTIKEAVMDIQKNFLLYTTSHLLKTVTGADISFTASTSTIADVHASFSDFAANEYITITGASDSTNNQTTQITTIASNYKSIVVTGTLADEAAGSSIVINEHLYSDWLLSHHHHILAVNYYASQAMTIYIDQSYDASNIDYTTTIPVLAATVMPPWEIDTTSKYFRVRILNGGVDQTDARIFVVGKSA